MPLNRGPIATLSSTDFHGRMASVWNMKPTPGVIPFTASPCTLTDPALGLSSPETSVRVVDFPHPVGPTIAQNSPGATWRDMSRIAV